MTAVLVCGGTLSADFLRDELKKYGTAVVFAVDGGLAVAEEAGIVPAYLVGDFDTAEQSLVKRYENRCITVRHQPEKDATDTELAIEQAIACGAERIVLLGATGSRMDHTVANLHMLYKVLRLGKTAEIVNETNRITMHNTSFRKQKDELFGTYVSFLPFGGEVKDVRLTGVKYPLDGMTLTVGNSLGVSNECVARTMEVSFSDGYLLMIEARD